VSKYEAYIQRQTQRLIETFQGMVEVRFHPVQATLAGSDLARARGVERGLVRRCTDCPLHATVTAPTPFSGGSRPVLVALGEGPGPQEERAGEPFIGPSGKLLRSLLREMGLDPDEEVMYVNTVQCHPKISTNTRAPTEQEQRWCRHHLVRALELAQTPYVLALGASATRAWREDLKVTHVHGRIFLWQGRRVIMPVLHPAAVLRQRNLKQTLRADIQKFVEMVRSGDVTQYLGTECVTCGVYASHVDPDAVPYCQVHWQRYGMRSYEKQWRRWQGEVVTPGQLDLGNVPTVERKKAKTKKQLKAD
jgi:DNA polymerase